MSSKRLKKLSMLSLASALTLSLGVSFANPLAKQALTAPGDSTPQIILEMNPDTENTIILDKYYEDATEALYEVKDVVPKPGQQVKPADWSYCTKYPQGCRKTK